MWFTEKICFSRSKTGNSWRQYCTWRWWKCNVPFTLSNFFYRRIWIWKRERERERKRINIPAFSFVCLCCNFFNWQTRAPAMYVLIQNPSLSLSLRISCALFELNKQQNQPQLYQVNRDYNMITSRKKKKKGLSTIKKGRLF